MADPREGAGAPLEGTPVDVKAWRSEQAPARPGAAGGGLPPGVRVDVSLPPPELVPYPQASDFALEGEQSIANGATAFVSSLQLPAGSVGVIRSVVLSAVNVTTALNATWALVVNGGAYEGWIRTIPTQNSASALLSFGPEETLVRLPAAAEIRLRISVVAGGPVTLGMRAYGWFYPFTLRDRYARAWG